MWLGSDHVAVYRIIEDDQLTILVSEYTMYMCQKGK